MLIDLIMPSRGELTVVRALAERGHQINRLAEMSLATPVGDIVLLFFGRDIASVVRHLARLQRSTPPHSPVVVLIPENDVGTKVELFREGVDECLVMPIDVAELEARLQALVIRFAKATIKLALRVADLKLDLETLVATRAGLPIHLYPASRKLLAALMAASPAVVDVRTLEQVVWSDHTRTKGNLRSHVYELRQSVDAGFDIKLIHVVRGVGYRLSADLEAPTTRRLKA
ncbi:response regulator transcription factor [Xanthomonas nasturtii]|uniref:DNA-binding response regulator n=1 Tax=Xanthomonas nasturtii TaxID=1843581 RepID=A0A3E1KF60_9XANT|nr:response regulator transcription factor [Xanthomonas nasturtii]MCL1500292.1 response regulator transcription factor [Xanthomonas nasturtii]MCL1523072.1 response regulator transcription factor [Xanthomonas nasturtii]MCL1530975.1 response regulator transcription factor [Xanthomonas nasturtii]MCL1565796.1 response regulator transcription factor [Xanthomonas nasturtii]MCL1569558.1 response regulator transcription factor [Xanthomonas nasturtii]